MPLRLIPTHDQDACDEPVHVNNLHLHCPRKVPFLINYERHAEPK